MILEYYIYCGQFPSIYFKNQKNRKQNLHWIRICFFLFINCLPTDELKIWGLLCVPNDRLYDFRNTASWIGKTGTSTPLLPE